VSSADLHFKCHLCEGSYAERQEALEHIHESHPSEFELIMSKTALDPNKSTGTEDNNDVNRNMTQHPNDGNAEGEESLEQPHANLPDYANRKVCSLFSALLVSYFQLQGKASYFDKSLYCRFAI
jgi:hypothetical protein